jgi:hypothetical protein
VTNGPFEDEVGIYLVVMTPEGEEEIYFDDFDEVYEVVEFLNNNPENYFMEVEDVD